MAAFASPLPIAVMTQLLGLPNDPERFRRLGSTIAQALDGIWSLRQARTLSAADAELRSHLRRPARPSAPRTPGDDLVSALVAEQGESLTERELAALVRLLLIAGFETTVNAIGNGMRWLLADPEQWETLVARPGSRRRGGRGGAAVRPPGAADRPGGSRRRRGRRRDDRAEPVGDHAAGRRQPGSRGLSRIRTVSTSPGSRRSSTSPSPAASTTASARRWPGWS